MLSMASPDRTITVDCNAGHYLTQVVSLQVQHVYTVLRDSGGGTRRAAMAELRQTYEASMKFSGKV